MYFDVIVWLPDIMIPIVYVLRCNSVCVSIGVNISNSCYNDIHVGITFFL